MEHDKARTSGESQAPRLKREVPNRKAVPVGVLYAVIEGGQVCFKVLYGKHIEQVVKDEISERFGAGAREWSNLE